MATRRVTSTPISQLVPGSNPNGFSTDVMVTNAGAATAFLDTDHQQILGDGYPLSAGSSKVWLTGRPLWHSSPTGTQLVITDEAGLVFDAGAIAGQILDQGLADAIADQIKLAGVPVVNKIDVLYDDVLTLANNQAWYGPAWDVAEAQGLYLMMNQSNGTHSQVVREGAVWWYGDAGMSQPLGAPDRFMLCCGADGAAELPTRGPYAQLLLEGAATPSEATSLFLTVSASYSRPIRKLFRFGWSGTTIHEGLYDLAGFAASPLAAAGAQLWFPNTVTGPATLTVSTAATTAGGPVILQLRTFPNTIFADVRVQAGPAGSAAVQLQLPPAPVYLRAQNNANAGVQVIASLAMAGY